MVMASNENKYYEHLDELYSIFRDHPYEDGDESMFNGDKQILEKIVQKNVRLFLQLRTQAMADLSRSKYEKAVIFLANLKDNISAQTQFFDKLNNTPQFAQLQPLFRNLSNLSEADKTSIVADAQLLNLLNDIEESLEENNNE
jgi:hypothetical protein